MALHNKCDHCGKVADLAREDDHGTAGWHQIELTIDREPRNDAEKEAFDLLPGEKIHDEIQLDACSVTCRNQLIEKYDLASRRWNLQILDEPRRRRRAYRNPG